MNKENQEFTFKQILKNISIVVGVIMLLRLIEKLIFQFQETKEFCHELVSSNSPLLYAMIVTFTVFFVWILISLLGASLYYLYKKIKGRVTQK